VDLKPVRCGRGRGGGAGGEAEGQESQVAHKADLRVCQGLGVGKRCVAAME
jgi:hypothetical protein